jgi:hypothetical protein
MWWKVSLALMVGVVVGVVISIMSFRHIYAHLIEVRSQGMGPWSSANKDWREFAIFLRYGGRESLVGAAHLAAELGINESQVRGLFGPPDQVAVGQSELGQHPGIYTKGRAGAYLYRVSLGVPAVRPHCRVFVIVFDESGRVIDRHNLGVSSDDQLSAFDKDTRTDRLVVP